MTINSSKENIIVIVEDATLFLKVWNFSIIVRDVINYQLNIFTSFRNDIGGMVQYYCIQKA